MAKSATASRPNAAYKEQLAKNQKEARWKAQIQQLTDVARGVEGSQGTVSLGPTDMETFMHLCSENDIQPRSVASGGEEAFEPDDEYPLEQMVYCEDLCAAVGLHGPPTHPEPPPAPVVRLVQVEPDPEEKERAKERAKTRAASAKRAARNRDRGEDVDNASLGEQTDPPDDGT